MDQMDNQKILGSRIVVEFASKYTNIALIDMLVLILQKLLPEVVREAIEVHAEVLDHSQKTSASDATKLVTGKYLSNFTVKT